MQRWTALAFLATVLGALAAIMLGGHGRATDVALSASPASAWPSPSMAPQRIDSPDPAADAAPPDLSPGDLVAAPPVDPSSAPLPAGAPKVVSFGVVLVAYKGAQGASAGARSKDEALRVAEDAASKAKTDFAAAVKLGDLGFDDAGEMPRGVLEPAAEAALFNLAPGEVSAPVDSPRGYYVFKRIE
jgi:hypothetical protein